MNMNNCLFYKFIRQITKIAIVCTYLYCTNTDAALNYCIGIDESPYGKGVDSVSYKNFYIHNIAWPKEKAIHELRGYTDGSSPNIIDPITRVYQGYHLGGKIDLVFNCLTDDVLRAKFDQWHHAYAHPFAIILGENIDDMSGSFMDRAKRIVGIRERAVAKIRTLVVELGQPADERLLNSDNDTGIYNELKRLTELRSRKIQEEQDKIRETELANLRAANEEARTNSERSAKAEKSYQESQKNLEVKLQEQIEKLENLQNQLKEQAKTEKILKQRQDRLYDALGDIFDQGEIQDPVMIEFFTKACELSPEFKSLFEDLKTAPAVRRLFKQRTQQLEKLFWSILKENKEMETLIDQPMQPAIGSTDSSLGNEALALPTVSSQTESNKSNEL